MKYIFEVEDFDDLYSGVNISQDYATNNLNTAVCAANIANAKLNALIYAAPVVYGKYNEAYLNFGQPQTTSLTHKAHLMFIEELVKEPCKHEPYHSNANVILASNPPQIPKPIYKCRKCGVELKAIWSEVK